jgi:hypothetical protein
VTRKIGNEPFKSFKEPALSPCQLHRGDCLNVAEGFKSFRVCEFLVPAQSVFSKYLTELWDDFRVSGIPETVPSYRPGSAATFTNRDSAAITLRTSTGCLRR